MSVRKRVLIAVLICVPLAGLIGYSVFQYVDGSGTQSAAEALPVVVRPVERRTMERVLTFTGNLEPQSTVLVIPKVPGQVKKVHVVEGQIVKRGQLIAEIDDRSVSYQRDQALAALEAAQAVLSKASSGAREEELANMRASVAASEKDLAVAQDNLDRSRRLYEAGTMAKAKLEEIEGQVRSAQTALDNAKRNLKMMEEGTRQEELEAARANVRAAQAQYELAQLQVDYTRVTAPAGGVVARVLVDEGNLVGQRDAVVALVQDDPITASVPLAERYFGEFLARMREDRRITARVYPQAYGGERAFPGVVSEMDTVVDSSSRTFTLTLKIENPERLLRPGMFATIDLVVDVYPDALVVPRSALSVRDGIEGVFTVGADSRASFTPVTTGISNAGYLVISEGLQAGQQIIVDGNAFLEDDQLVRAVEG